MSGDPTKDEDSDTSGGVEATRRRSAELFAALRDGSAPEQARDEAREDLVHLHLPMVEHCARRFRNRGEPFEDLVQVGTIGLLKSIDRAIAFPTHRIATTSGSPIWRAIANSWSSLRLADLPRVTSSTRKCCGRSDPRASWSMSRAARS